MAHALARTALPCAALLMLMGMAVGCQADHGPQMVDRIQPQFTEPAVTPTPPAQQRAANSAKLSGHGQQQVSAPLSPAPMPPVPQMVGIPRDWVPLVAPRRWEWIVVHHSATPFGGAARFGREHQAKGWDELGYHFVVGNGTDTANGLIEVGSRWPKQKQGAHCKTADNNFNDHGIGICLVGNFDTGRPTAAQLQSAAKLVAYLMKTYHIPADHVIGHGDAKATDCPGKNLHIAQIRNLSVQVLAAAGTPVPTARLAAAPGKELLVNSRASVR